MSMVRGIMLRIWGWRSSLCALGAVLVGSTIVAPRHARADRREIYTLVGYAPGVSHFRVPGGHGATTNAYANAIDLTSYYGLTHSLHVGGLLRLASSADARFAGATARLPDGTDSVGNVYADHRALGVGALLLYRLDTGIALAPAVMLEGGLTIHQYRDAVHVAAGVGTPLGEVTETVPHGSATVLLEYRFLDRWVAALGVGVSVEPGLMPWSIFAPLRVGRIW